MKQKIIAGFYTYILFGVLVTASLLISQRITGEYIYSLLDALKTGFCVATCFGALMLLLVAITYTIEKLLND